MGISIDEMAGDAQNGTNGAPSTYAAKYNLAPHFIGGNHLNAASPGKVKDFVTAHDGHTVITNVRTLPLPRGQTAELATVAGYTG